MGFVPPLAPAAYPGLLLNLPLIAKLVLPIWGAVGLAIYFLYSRGHSHVGLGRTEVHELDKDAPPQPVPPVTD